MRSKSKTTKRKKQYVVNTIFLYLEQLKKKDRQNKHILNKSTSPNIRYLEMLKIKKKFTNN